MDESVSLARLAHRLEEVVGELRGIPIDVERLEDRELVRQQIAQAAASAGELRAMHPVGSSEEVVPDLPRPRLSPTAVPTRQGVQ
ncbi:hypothetical protein [Nonomuraea aurantiaca]|uniref:hypothetical protein n=1 Tax=Nonomuraea aurantiaca TaxID=2878562 RepID=UPI001CDA5292|nr:hypothetical protein [Nonomuraea aurantiaca]MCA2220829.1 hypothetical protein [Nonomuraea aurantiaca]